MVITNAGLVGIGTTAPTALLTVSGDVSATGNVTATTVTASGGPSAFTDPTNNGSAVQGSADNGPGAWGVWGESAAGYGVYGSSTTGTGVWGKVASGTSVVAGQFNVTGGTTGKALSATVNNTETMNVDVNGVHAGPGMTGTPVAYASVDSGGAAYASSNISCGLHGDSLGAYYDCTIPGYLPTVDVAVVTAVSNEWHPVVAVTGTGGTNVLRIRLYDLTVGTSSSVQNAFHVVVFKP